MSQDAWLIAKGISSIGPLRAEKTSKMFHFSCRSEIASYFTHFGHFLRPPWSDWANSFCNEPGILRLPTTYYYINFENSLFFSSGPFSGWLIRLDFNVILISFTNIPSMMVEKCHKKKYFQILCGSPSNWEEKYYIPLIAVKI